MKMGRLALITVALTVALSCPSAADEAEDKAAILAIWDTYEESRMAGDADAWLELWDENSLQIPSQMPPRNKEQLGRYVQKAFKEIAATAVEISSEEVVIMGEWAFSRGSYKMSLKHRALGSGSRWQLPDDLSQAARWILADIPRDD